MRKKAFAAAGMVSLSLCMFMCVNGAEHSGNAEETVQLKNCPISHQDGSSGLYLEMSIEDFNDLGFAYGDTVDLAFSNGYEMEEVPYFTGYYTEPYQPVMVAYPGHAKVKVTINYGEDLWEVAGLEKGDTVSVSMHEKGGRLDEQKASDLHYTDVREDYASDEVFSNFREVTVGNVKKGTMYRSASPCDNIHRRASCTDRLASEAGIKCIVDLADSDQEIEAFLASEDFDSPFFKELYTNHKVLPLSLTMNYLDVKFQKALAEGLTAMAQEEGPYLIHCQEGKDRTGFVCMLVEGLCGASYQEIVEDYMLTYDNYYGINREKDPERYETIKRRNIDFMIREVISDENVDITKADLAGYVKDYLLRIGMDEQTIDRLRERFVQ